MELREYWRVFKRRAWIPLLLLVVTVATAGALAYLSKPEYIATATVTAKSSGAAAGQFVSFPEVATSNNVAVAAIKQLGLPITAAELINRIKVSSGRSTVFKISITDPDANRATAIANAVAQEAAVEYPKANTDPGSTVYDQDVKDARAAFQKYYADAATELVTFNRQHPNAVNSSDVALAVQAMQLRLQEQAAAAAYQDFENQTTTASVGQLSDTIKFGAAVTDRAAAKPDTSSRFLRVGYAGALAVILGIGLIFLLEYMDNSVRDPEGAEEMVGAPVVGIIPRATAQTLRTARGGAR